MTAPLFPGQPFAPDEDTRADTTLVALSDALTFLSSAAFVAGTSEAGRMEGLLDAGEEIALGFPADSDEAKGLHLIIGAILDGSVTA